MKYHVLTLFPEMILQALNTSIIGRAVEKNLIQLNAVNIRDYTQDRHGKVDDYPYGGGAGMLMQAQPVYDAHRAVSQGRKVRTIYVTPKGARFSQKLALDFAKEEELIFLCGHYEGIDERVLEEIVTDYVSIGDYVLTGGELPAMVMIDAISRLVPGVLNNDLSAETESFHRNLLEYPQYSRPEIWHEKSVPKILLSGDHRKIEAWRLQMSEQITKERRYDLYEKYLAETRAIHQLSKKKRNNIHMIESLRRGNAELLFENGSNILLYDRGCDLCMLTASDEENCKRLLDRIPADIDYVIVQQEFAKRLLCEQEGFTVYLSCRQACYTKGEPLPVRQKDIRILESEYLPYLSEHYQLCDEQYLKERIMAKAVFGAFLDDQLVGFVGWHAEGSIGLLYVEEAYRGRGIGKSLEAYAINRQREMGYIPYGQIIEGNDRSIHLQEKLGLYLAEETIWWLTKSSSSEKG